MSISNQINTNATLLSSRQQLKSTHKSEMTIIREMDDTCTYSIPDYDENLINTLNLHLSTYTQDYTVESPTYHYTEEEDNHNLTNKTSNNFDQDVLDLYHKKRSLNTKTSTIPNTLTNTKFTEIKPIDIPRDNSIETWCKFFACVSTFL